MDNETIGKIYDEFDEDGQNMPKDQFVRQVSDLLDPTKMLTDLQGEQLKRGMSAMNKKRIDNAIKTQKKT